MESINAKKTIKQIRRGLSIYSTGRSPFWHARIYDPMKKKYVVRSTKETNRIEAIEVAEEILETYKSKQNPSHATSKDRSFEYYAKLLADLNAQRSKSPIDDRTANGAGQFKGEHIHFGSEKFPDWNSVLAYLL